MRSEGSGKNNQAVRVRVSTGLRGTYPTETALQGILESELGLKMLVFSGFRA